MWKHCLLNRKLETKYKTTTTMAPVTVAGRVVDEISSKHNIVKTSQRHPSTPKTTRESNIIKHKTPIVAKSPTSPPAVDNNRGPTISRGPFAKTVLPPRKTISNSFIKTVRYVSLQNARKLSTTTSTSTTTIRRTSKTSPSTSSANGNKQAASSNNNPKTRASSASTTATSWAITTLWSLVTGLLVFYNYVMVL